MNNCEDAKNALVETWTEMRRKRIAVQRASRQYRRRTLSGPTYDRILDALCDAQEDCAAAFVRALWHCSSVYDRELYAACCTTAQSFDEAGAQEMLSKMYANYPRDKDRVLQLYLVFADRFCRTLRRGVPA